MNQSTIIKSSRRSRFIISLQKFWTAFHFFLIYLDFTFYWHLFKSNWLESLWHWLDNSQTSLKSQSHLKYQGADLTALCSVISITNLPGIPFCIPRVAVVARRLWFVNRPSIPASLHKLFKKFPPAYCGLLDNFHTKLQNIYIKKILWDYIYNLTYMICYFL